MGNVRIWKQGGETLLNREGETETHHLNSFDTDIDIDGIVTIKDLSPIYPEDWSGLISEVQNESGTPIGDETAVRKYLAGLKVTEVGGKISILSDRTSFGEVLVAMNAPVVQIKAAYGLHPKARILTVGTGTAGAIDNLYTITTGTGQNSLGALFSIRQLTYRAGQGAKARGTVIFDTPKSGSIQAWGLATAADAFQFTYNEDADFCVQRSFDGHVIIQKLTLTTPASGSENATVTIDGVGYTVPLTAGTAVHNTNEITNSLNSQVPNWSFSQNNGFVISRSLIGAPAVGAFTFSSSTAIAVFTEIHAGVTASIDCIVQSDWNVDKMDGKGVSGMLLDQQKGNVYQIQFQYLGFGAINFFIEDENTGEFQLVHQIKYTNRFIVPLVSNPIFRITWNVENITNNTNIVIKGSSAAGFIEGFIQRTDSGFAEGTTKNIGTTEFINLGTIRNRTVFGTNVNLAEVTPQLVSAFADTNKGAIINITKGTIDNPVSLGGTPNFTYKDEQNSIVEFDSDGTTVTGGILIHEFIAGQVAKADLRQFNDIIHSGETLTISAQIISGAASDVTVTLNWSEEI